MDFLREWYIGFSNVGSIKKICPVVMSDESWGLKWRNPDLLCVHNKHGLIIIEVDGKVHDKYVDKTNRRNEQYKKAGIKFIVLNLGDIIHSGKSIFEYLDCEMDKLLGGKCAKH